MKRVVKVPNCKIRIEKKIFCFDLELSLRRTMSVSVVVRSAEVRVVVKAPAGIDFKHIESFIVQKQDWIRMHKQRLQDLLETRPPRSYEDGARHLLLNRSLELKVIPALFDKVERQEDRLCVYTRDKDAARVKALVRKWYADQVPGLMEPVVWPMIRDFVRRHGVRCARVEFKYASSYWGVCTGRGVIRLNIELLRAPRECIEYIVMHELCHLVHPNHSADFYRLLSEEMPDWKQRKEWLERTVSCKD